MQSKGKGLNRRQFLKWSIGTALLAAIPSSIMPIWNKARAAETHMESETDQPSKTRAWCMIADLRKCDGCVGIDAPPQCTQACITGHYAPKGEQWIEVYKKDLPGGGSFFMPAPCFQCENAPCVNVCPVGATYHGKDGVVLIDHNRCIGCRMCMAACPYQRRFFNWGDVQLPPEAALVEYSPVYPVPPVKGTVIKCMFCAHLLANGRLPLCVVGCPTKALYMGDLNEDVASNGKEVVKLSKFLDENSAYQYKETLGTKPRMWFIPGYGQETGRKPNDPRNLKAPVWQWGGDGFNRRPGVFPWGEDF